MNAEDIRRQYRGQIDLKTAAEMQPHLQAELEAAQRRWRDELPALKTAARLAYDQSFAKGGNNARKRATRAARAIWAGFTA